MRSRRNGIRIWRGASRPITRGYARRICARSYRGDIVKKRNRTVLFRKPRVRSSRLRVFLRRFKDNNVVKDLQCNADLKRFSCRHVLRCIGSYVITRGLSAYLCGRYLVRVILIIDM